MNLQIKAIFLCVLTLISCSRTKPRHQFIVASSFCIENLLINIWSFVAQPCRCWKKVTVVLKVLPSFRDFNWVFSYQLTEIQLCYLFSCLLRPLRAKFESCLSEMKYPLANYNERVAQFSIMRSRLSQLSNKYCNGDRQFSM